MKTRSAQVSPRISSNQRGIVRRSLRMAALFVFAVAVILAATATPLFSQKPSQTAVIPNVKCVIGLENFKPNTTGSLSLLPTGLQFTNNKSKADIATASITDMFTGNQSRQDVSGVGGTIVKAGIPYEGGRILSLFSHKVEVLTVEYTDSNGGFHGAIFVLPPGHATALKDSLVAQGAKVTTHVEPAAPKEEQKP